MDSSGNNIGLNSIQTLCLIRNIPLLFGDIVPEGNGNCFSLLLLLQMINIIFSPSVKLGTTALLKHLIMVHHELFKELFPEKSLYDRLSLLYLKNHKISCEKTSDVYCMSLGDITFKMYLYGPMKSINVDNDSDVLARALHVESVSQDIHATNWVTISVTEYRAGLIICRLNMKCLCFLE